MKQDLWLANSSLLLMFALVLTAYELLQQEVPSWNPPKVFQPTEIEKKKEESTQASQPAWEKIYQDDVFGTYLMQETKAVKQSLLTPIPEPRVPVIPPPQEPKKQEFIAPLSMTVHGIIAGSEETKNVAMIADETGKEGMYHLGEKVKDAQIIKIAQNRIVLLRANGQQEVFYLRKDDLTSEQNAAERWKYIVKKVNDQSFEVDPGEFIKEIETLGRFISETSVIGTAFHLGKPLGIRIGKVDKSIVAPALGLFENDIITTINDLNVADARNRIKAYDAITQLPLESTIKIGLQRAGKDVLLSYKLVKLERPRKTVFPGITVASTPQASPVAQLPMNRLQQRDQTVRDFGKLHPEEERHQQAMMEIRRRILENLQRRFQGGPR